MTSWNVSDWSYTAEGGKHAIFRYSPSSTTLATDNKFCGHVLRIAKSDLVATFHIVNQAESTSTSTPYQVPNKSTTSQLFQKNIIQPLIGRQYIDLGHTVHLPISFCSQLYQQTISSGLIPYARLSSWQKKNCNGSVCNEKGIAALLLRDYTTYLLSPPPSSAASQLQSKSSTSSKMFSVEIKPKAGYITTSPLVLPNHRCKYQHTRYSLQQELMRLGVIKKGWQQQQIASSSEDGCGFTPSQYSPLNLFSNDINQIHKAISDLMNNMQNNIRIWYDGKQIFGLGSDVTVELDDCHVILNDMLGNNDDSKPATTLLDVITRIVATILHHEHDLLSNILSIQQLDVIDGDGAAMIYERLVQLCNGSNVEAEALLDEALLVPSDEFAADAVEKQHGDCYITESSPFTFPRHCKSLRNLLDEIEKFDKYMRDHRPNQEASAGHDHTDDNNGNLDESIVNTAHIRSMEHINHLSKEGCIYLLQNWLLSLVLCDVSFFITFQIVPIESDHQEVMTKCQSDNQSGIVVCLLPTKNDAPSTLSSSASSCSMAIQYEVKVVDCDPKPAKKLRGRKEVEGKFSAI